jgi:ABC-type uncharacterized transport system permease subunit
MAAGLAGASEVAGPLGQLQRSVSTGYGYAAIIVAYVGGLNPAGIVASAFLMSVVYIGGRCDRVGGPAGGRRLGVSGAALGVLSGGADLHPAPRGADLSARGGIVSGIEFILAGTLAAATPLLLAALGEMVVERTGVLNLGIEGMMALGAALAFITVYQTAATALGFWWGGAGPVCRWSLRCWSSAVVNQVAAGLAISVLGLGLSALFGKSMKA